MQALNGRGFADVCISMPEATVLEATCNSMDIDECFNCFLNAWKYEALLETGGIKQHAVIVFLSPGSAIPTFQSQHLYHVLFQPAYEDAVIYHMGKQHPVRVAGKAHSATQMAHAAALLCNA